MQVNREELESCYQKFQILKLRMSIANKKYRLSKKGIYIHMRHNFYLY